MASYSVDPNEVIRAVDSGTRAEVETHGRIDRDKQDYVKFTGNGTYRQIVAEADNDDATATEVGFSLIAKGADTQVGAVPAASITAGVTVREYGGLVWHRTRFILDEVEIATTDDGSSGSYGAIQLYDFPMGDIVVRYGRMTITAMVAGTGSILDACDGIDIGVGQDELAAAATSLSGDYENLVNLDDLTLSGGVLAAQATILEATGDTIIGNTTAAGGGGNAFLNVAITSGGTGTAQGTYPATSDTLTVTGEIDLIWMNYGDY